MATGTIKKTGLIFFNCTPNTGLTRSRGIGVYDKASGTVIVFVMAYQSGALARTTTLATIPPEYRPSTQIQCLAEIGANGTIVSGYGYINTNGTVVQDESGNAGSATVIGVYTI